MRRQATEQHLKDGGIYRMRWWACFDRRQNRLRDVAGSSVSYEVLGLSSIAWLGGGTLEGCGGPAVVWRESYCLLLALRTPGGLWKHHFHAAGNRKGQPHDVPDLSAGRDRPFTPCRHAVVLDAKELCELFPRQPSEFGEPLQPLPEVLREEFRVRALYPLPVPSRDSSSFYEPL